MTEEDIKAALDCLTYWPTDSSPRVSHGRQKQFQRHVLDIIDNGTSYDAHEDKMIKQTLVAAMHNLLVDVKEELHENPSQDPVSTFESLKPQTLRETLGRTITTYTIVFPLNIQRIRKFPPTFSAPETTIKHISRDTWKTDYESEALKDNSLKRFLNRVSPNSLDPDRFGNEKFTFWTADFDARDGHYALFQLQEIIRLFVSKLNYTFHKRQPDRPQPSNKERPPYARWSPLREPFFYLIFDGESYVDYHPMDYDYRRTAYFTPRNVEELVDQYLKLPDLPATPHYDATTDNSQASLDGRLVDALFAYQDGITASTPQQSFFSFWRGIETLTHVTREQPAELVLNRAQQVFEKRSKGEYVPREQQDAIKELRTKRNDIAHIGSHIHIQEPHRTITKRMLDKLLQLHFDYYPEYDTRDFQTYLTHHSKQFEEKKDQLKRNKRRREVLIDTIYEDLEESDDPLFVETHD